MKKILEAGKDAPVHEPKVDDLLDLADFKIERQETAGKPGNWDKLPWQAVSVEKNFEILSAAEDFDEDVIWPTESSLAITSFLPKRKKGTWDDRVTHPQLKGNKLSKSQLDPESSERPAS